MLLRRLNPFKISRDYHSMIRYNSLLINDVALTPETPIVRNQLPVESGCGMFFKPSNFVRASSFFKEF